MPKHSAGDLTAMRIREARSRLGFNQARLAAEAEITPAAISQIESGERIPSTPVLRKLAYVLQVSTDYLLGETDKSEFEDLLQNEKVQKFFRGFQNLNPNDQKIIQQQIEFLKSNSRK